MDKTFYILSPDERDVLAETFLKQIDQPAPMI
jgi:hypothetical protein